MCILKADTLYEIAFFSRCRDFGVLLEKQFGALYTGFCGANQSENCANDAFTFVRRVILPAAS